MERERLLAAAVNGEAAMAPSHIGQVLSRLAVERANLPLTISSGRTKTGAQFVERIQSLAAGLRVTLGLQCGDRVAIAALNSDLYLEWLLAVPCAGGIIAPLNYRWSCLEACEALQQIEPIFLVIDQHCATLSTEIKRKFPTLQLITLDYTARGALLAESILLPSRKGFHLCWAPDAVALICFTSGTTGKPKGAAISHNAIIVQSLAKIAMVNYSCSDVYLHTSPLCHIGGISSAHAMLLVGACHVFLPKFHALDAFDVIKEHHVTAMIAVPAMLQDLTSLLLSRNSDENCKLPSVAKILIGAGSLSLDLLQRTVRSFPSAQIFSAYGMTEACSSMSFITLYNPTSCENDLGCLKEERNASDFGGFCVGKPAPHVELIVSTNWGLKGSNRGCLLEEGDVMVRGPHMMQKYWGKEHTFDEDGWFHTGDVGWMDHMGQLWLLGRRKDVIKSGGENVHCYEVEEIISRHPGVEAVAVAGVHDARLGEIVGAMILLRKDWRWKEEILNNSRLEWVPLSGNASTCPRELMNERVLSANLLQLFCGHQGLSSYKIPKIWCQKRGVFAVTSTGKLRKDVVRNELAAQARGQSRCPDIEATFSSKL